MQKLNKKQKDAITYLINNRRVDDYHKTLLKAINIKNVSIAENTFLVNMFDKYFNLLN